MVTNYPLVDVEALAQASTKEVVFDWQGNTIWLQLEPDAEPTPKGPHSEAVLAWLSEVIEDWNLARKGKKLPIKRKTMKMLPRALVDRMRDEVQRALNMSLSAEEAQTP